MHPFWAVWMLAAVAVWFVCALIMLATSEPSAWRDLVQSLAFLAMLPVLPIIWLTARSPKVHNLQAASLARFADACAADQRVWSFSYRQRGIIVVRRGPGWRKL